MLGAMRHNAQDRKFLTEHQSGLNSEIAMEKSWNSKTGQSLILLLSLMNLKGDHIE